MKLFALTAICLFAGCLGIGPNEAGFRDVVTVEYSAVDVETGATILANEPLTFILVAGQSGLGHDFENAIIGMAVNETKTFSSKDASRDYTEPVSATRVFADIPLVREIDTQSLASFLQKEPEVGDVFDLPFYPAVVEQIEAGIAYYRLQPQPGQLDPLPELGSNLVTTVEGDFMTQTLEPVIGATIVIQPPSPFDPTTPLDLPIGSLKVVGAEGDQLLFKHNPTLNPELLGKNIRFTITLLSVEKTSVGVEPVDGNYGSRYSPQLLGAPDVVVAEDGHTGHTH